MVHKLFPTAVLKERIELPEELRRETIQWLLELCRDSVERRIAMNPEDFYGLHLLPEMRPVLKAVASEVGRFAYDDLYFCPSVTTFHIGRCWPVVRFREGGSMHFHAGSVFSGVLYLQVPEGAGGIEFMRPFRTAADSLFKTQFTDLSSPTASLEIAESELCLFSSELVHHSKNGSADHADPLVAIAFDLYSMTSIKNVTGGLPDRKFVRSLDSFIE